MADRINYRIQIMSLFIRFSRFSLAAILLVAVMLVGVVSGGHRSKSIFGDNAADVSGRQTLVSKQINTSVVIICS